MAATTTAGISIPASAAAPGHLAPSHLLRANRRRRIGPEAGHALEKLGHAIEYLSDEFVHEGGALDAHNAQVEAVQLLMALNRRIYLECPQIPSLGERWQSFLHRHLL
jgi:hypothetical protein